MCRWRVDWNIHVPAQSWSWQITTQTNTRQLSLVWWWLHQRCTCLAGHRRRCSGLLLLWNAMWRVFYAQITTTEPSKLVFPSIYNYLSITQIRIRKLILGCFTKELPTYNTWDSSCFVGTIGRESGDGRCHVRFCCGQVVGVSSPAEG